MANGSNGISRESQWGSQQRVNAQTHLSTFLQSQGSCCKHLPSVSRVMLQAPFCSLKGDVELEVSYVEAEISRLGRRFGSVVSLVLSRVYGISWPQHSFTVAQHLTCDGRKVTEYDSTLAVRVIPSGTLARVLVGLTPESQCASVFQHLSAISRVVLSYR